MARGMGRLGELEMREKGGRLTRIVNIKKKKKIVEEGIQGTLPLGVVVDVGGGTRIDGRGSRRNSGTTIPGIASKKLRCGIGLDLGNRGAKNELCNAN